MYLLNSIKFFTKKIFLIIFQMKIYSLDNIMTIPMQFMLGQYLLMGNFAV